MDTAPHGKRNELRPALRFLGRQRPACTRILQLRDIPFPPGTDGRQCHGLERLRAEGELYDRIFVAGHERFFDVCAEHTLTDGVASKIEYIGFVNADLNGAAPPAGALGRKPVSANDCRFDAMLERPAQRIVVGFGGGWESDQLGPMVLEAFDRLSRRDGVERQLFLFTGPEIGADVYEAMERRLAGRASAWIRRFSPRFPEALARCDLAVLQAGSSVYQILDSDKPLILYTRDFKTSEQQDRARRLARFPGITLIDQDWLASHDLSRLMDDLLTAPRAPRRTGFDFDGARRAADAIAAVLNRRDARRSGMK
jgi:predicted glycosyltransferase